MEENRELWSFIGKFTYKLIKQYNQEKKFAKCFEKESVKEIAILLQKELKNNGFDWTIEKCITKTEKTFHWFSERNEVLGRENVQSNEKNEIFALQEIQNQPNATIKRKLNGKLHAKMQPALEEPNGYKEWRIHGVLHRTDGPAVEYSNGFKEYWVSGREVYDFIKYGLDYDFVVLKTTEKSHLIAGVIQVPTTNYKYPGIYYKKVEVCEWIPRDYQEKLWANKETEIVILNETHKKISVLFEDKVKEYKIPDKFAINKNIAIKVEDF